MCPHSRLDISVERSIIRYYELLFAKANHGQMIKSELVQRINDRNSRLLQREIEIVVNTILSEIVEAMIRRDRVELRGLGAFSVKVRPARAARDPRSGRVVSVSQKWVPSFKLGKKMRLRINKK